MHNDDINFLLTNTIIDLRGIFPCHVVPFKLRSLFFILAQFFTVLVNSGPRNILHHLLHLNRPYTSQTDKSASELHDLSTTHLPFIIIIIINIRELKNRFVINITSVSVIFLPNLHPTSPYRQGLQYERPVLRITINSRGTRLTRSHIFHALNLQDVSIIAYRKSTTFSQRGSA